MASIEERIRQMQNAHAGLAEIIARDLAHDLSSTWTICQKLHQEALDKNPTALDIQPEWYRYYFEKYMPQSQKNLFVLPERSDLQLQQVLETLKTVPKKTYEFPGGSVAQLPILGFVRMLQLNELKRLWQLLFQNPMFQERTRKRKRFTDPHQTALCQSIPSILDLFFETKMLSLRHSNYKDSQLFFGDHPELVRKLQELWDMEYAYDKQVERQYKKKLRKSNH